MDVGTTRCSIIRTFILGEAEWILHSRGCWCCRQVELDAWGRGAGLIPGPSPAWLGCDQNTQPLMAVLWYMWNEWLQFLGSSPTNHKNITCGRHSREKPKDKLAVVTGFAPCERQDKIFQTQAIRHLNIWRPLWRMVLKQRWAPPTHGQIPTEIYSSGLLVQCHWWALNSFWLRADNKHAKMK